MSPAAAAPWLSVLLPCYNAEPYLSSCLDSLLAQTYSDFEIVAVDDGSQDGTARTLAEYAVRDRRLRLSHNPHNIGLIRTLNYAIEQSRGAYIARMDADDQADPGRFQSQVAFLEAHPDVDMVSSSLTLIDGADRVIGERRVWVTHPTACRYLTGFATPMAHSAVMGRRQCFTAFGYSLEPDAQHTEDYELWCRLVRAGKRLANIPDPLLRYRMSPQRVSARYEATQVQNFVSCVQHHLREETGMAPSRASVETLANRIDFSRSEVLLDEGLRLLETLTQRARSSAVTEGERAEIRSAATMQRLDILTQCLLKGYWRVRMQAARRLLGAAFAALSLPHPRRYLLGKIRHRRLVAT